MMVASDFEMKSESEVEVLNELISMMDVNARDDAVRVYKMISDDEKRTALTFAAASPNWLTSKVLISARADVNHVDSFVGSKNVKL